MLEEMRIAGLGVIDEAHLELGPGLCVVTGETGAGKTMIVSGLGLLLGARADAALVRSGCDRAVVEGRFRVPADGAVADRVQEIGGELDEDGTLLVLRTVGADGRSRAVVGGRSVPVGVLSDLAAHLVTIHGQSDQLRLVKPAVQRDLLDAYSGRETLEVRARYTEAFARHRALCAELHTLTTRARERAQEADLLSFGLDEIAAAAPQPGEDTALEEDIARLSHVEALGTAAVTAHAALVGDADNADAADAMTFLTAARSALETASAHDRTLAELARHVAEAAFLVADAGADLASYAQRIEADPARLQALQERKATLTRLVRKYATGGTGGTGGIDGVLGWAQAAAARLAELGDSDERITALGAERETLERAMASEAARLSAARGRAAAALAAAVGAELSALAMPDATLSVAVAQVDAADGQPSLDVDGRALAFGAHGVDDVEFRLSAHAGAPARPLHRGASGGELSRVMLALEVVLAGADPVATLIFDEVDAGVGGRAAVEVGRRLSVLARCAQVIVVTHLPQVAAYADTHLVIVKSKAGSVVASGVTAADGPVRVGELSRMLAGLAESELARGHAEELLAAAAAERASPAT